MPASKVASDHRPVHARNTKTAPICGARRKDGTLCKAVQRCANGRCRNHGGLATGRPLVAGQIHTATMARLRAECDALARDEAALLNTVPIIAKMHALCQRLEDRVARGDSPAFPEEALALYDQAR